jgi:8-oxo-dGTP pyrophosphatase MutT (NUDIX family)
MSFPVSVKGVLIDGTEVVLLENERGEWELPGGRLEPGEHPPACVAREISEELGIEVAVEDILDCWLYEVLPGREVVIVTYGVRRLDAGEFRISHEHKRIGHFAISELDRLPMPEGYRRSIRAWTSRPGRSTATALRL